MSARSSDRNLLFGILALQMDFIERDALIGAMNRWALNKSTPLGEILVADKCLSAGDRELLEQMVDRHVSLHDEDPEKSLAAIRSMDTVCADLDGIDDVDLEASLHCVSEASTTRTAGSTITFVGSTSSMGTERSAHDRFQVLRPHARGGLGKVSVALDCELNREVALKEIQDEFADDVLSRNRFTLEAEITGGLEHPGIVPVYGLGKRTNGRPFYAMRFIKGSSLRDSCKTYHQSRPQNSPSANSLEFRKLLGHFVDVCNAVEYAHSRGVIHRDIKPSNIMIGRYGETFVVDWGLAKPIGRTEGESKIEEMTLRPSSSGSSAATQIGSTLGTPSYMPPEQAAGKLDQLGPASDVYSLGATLYFLLTNRSPFSDSDQEIILSMVQAGEFDPPRMIDSTISPQLEAICLKAMTYHAKDRYSTPSELAGDVERWMADEAVSAFPESWLTRARRSARRHQSMAVATSIVVCITIVGLLAFAIVVNGKNSTLNRLTQSLQQRNSQLIAANEREQDARDRAEQGEESARRLGELAIMTLHQMVDDMQVGLSSMPRAGALRRSLLNTALTHLELIATDFADQARVDHTTMIALSEMGDMALRFGPEPGEPVISDRGDPNPSSLELARRMYSRAFEIAQQLADDQPADDETQFSLAVAHEKMGDLYLLTGDEVDAAKSYQQSQDIFADLLRKDPDDPSWRRAMSVSLGKLGNATFQLGNKSVALTLHQQSLSIDRELLSENENDTRAMRDLSVSLIDVGEILQRSQRSDEALEYYEEALEIRQELVDLDPDDINRRRDLAVAFSRVGDIRLQLGQVAESEAAYRHSFEIRTQLVELDPQKHQVQRDLAISNMQLGDIYRRTARPDEAIPFYSEMNAILLELYEADPNSLATQRDLSFSYAKRGETLLAIGDVTAAMDDLERCLELRQTIADTTPESIRGSDDLADAHGLVGTAKLEQGSFDEALHHQGESLRLRGEVSQLDPDNAAALRSLSVAQNRYADVLRDMGRTREALDYYLRSRELKQSLSAGDPTDAVARRDLIISHALVGGARRRLAEYEAAIADFETALDLATQLQREGLLPGNIDELISSLEQSVDQAQVLVRATLDQDLFARLPDEEQRSLLYDRVAEFTKHDRLVEARMELQRWESLANDDDYNLYLLASGYGILIMAIEQSERPADDELAAEISELQVAAIDALRRAIAAGYDDLAILAIDEDFESLRELPEFRELIEQ